MSPVAYACAYDAVLAIAAARTRHPDLDWIVTESLRRPYLLRGRAKTVYLDGRPDPNDCTEALLAGIVEIDNRHASCPVVPLHAGIRARRLCTNERSAIE